jgi:hypothetical protein
VENTNLPWGVRHLAGAVNSMVVAKMTGANNGGRLSWVSAVYRPVYRVRAYVKVNIRPRSLFLYNVIKFSAIGAGLLFVVATFYLLTSALTDR